MWEIWKRGEGRGGGRKAGGNGKGVRNKKRVLKPRRGSGMLGGRIKGRAIERGGEREILGM